MNEHFHNTINEEGTRLDEHQVTARTQDEKILEFFKTHGFRNWTPCEVHVAMSHSMLLTSMRRAINNLTRDGHLTKTNIRRDGSYGAKNYAWEFVPSPEEQGQGRLF